MQLDHYHSPFPAQEPAAPAKPARRRRKALVLALFLALILLLAGTLVALRIFLPAGAILSPEDILRQIPGLEDWFEPEEPEWVPDIPVSLEPESLPAAELAPGVTLELTPLPEEPLSFQEIYQKVIPSIVSIQCYSRTSSSEGTGVIMTSDGYIITNHHIIDNCSYADVMLSDGTYYEARLVGSDAESDLAVLKIDADSLTPAEFGISDALQVGEDVVAIGNPLGSELFGTMTEGIVSAINRDVNVDGYTMTLIQTTAALNPGNSGGALLNTCGQVVGITNMKMMSDYNTIEGLGFAIPTVSAKEVADVLLAFGKITGRPTIGFVCFTVPADYIDVYGHAGVCIQTVTVGGPADSAGVRPGDIVIAANGQVIATLEELTAVRDAAGVGGTLDLTIWRDGEILRLSLTLVEQYELN